MKQSMSSKHPCCHPPQFSTHHTNFCNTHHSLRPGTLSLLNWLDPICYCLYIWRVICAYKLILNFFAHSYLPSTSFNSITTNTSSLPYLFHSKVRVILFLSVRFDLLNVHVSRWPAVIDDLAIPIVLLFRFSSLILSAPKILIKYSFTRQMIFW